MRKFFQLKTYISSLHPLCGNLMERAKVIKQKGGRVAQLVKLATPGKEVLGSIPAVAARSLLVGSVSV